MSDISSKIFNTKIPEVNTPNSLNTDFIAPERPTNYRNFMDGTWEWKAHGTV